MFPHLECEILHFLPDYKHNFCEGLALIALLMHITSTIYFNIYSLYFTFKPYNGVPYLTIFGTL